MCRFAEVVLYISVELLKRIPIGVIVIAQGKYLHSQYIYFYIVCLACCYLHVQWSCLRTILLSGDVESNPGPETFDFCTWNLNSIAPHDFLRVSLIEAYSSVYSYDLIGIVETHLDSTVDKDRLSLDGYTFINDNYPQNMKRGGVGLYIKDSLPSPS